ncbi:MAG: EamA/RhaT family transporter, partial [Burkholderiales bacterium]|nr:EamA/RhaT family transporter [Burkholderiales bacterium]
MSRSGGGAHAPSWIGTVCVFLSAVGFSLKAILIKATYAHGVDAATVLALRMLFSAPFFVG